MAEAPLLVTVAVNDAVKSLADPGGLSVVTAQVLETVMLHVSNLPSAKSLSTAVGDCELRVSARSPIGWWRSSRNNGPKSQASTPSADAVHLGAVLLCQLLELARANEILLCESSLREGLVLE